MYATHDCSSDMGQKNPWKMTLRNTMKIAGGGGGGGGSGPGLLIMLCCTRGILYVGSTSYDEGDLDNIEIQRYIAIHRNSTRSRVREYHAVT
jgi:hypothetical protein